MKKEYTTNSELETFELGFNIGREAEVGDIYCLDGELGVGKTVFAKGFAKGLGILENVSSPTFSIVNEYKGDKNFYHFDVYRINNVEEMEDTGYEDYFYGDGVCLVEWSELIKVILPKNSKFITIEKDYEKDENIRIIQIQ